MFLREMGIVPGGEADRSSASGHASLTNLSPHLARRGFLGGSGVFVLGLTLAGCNSYVEPEVDADAFDLGDPGASPLTEVKGGDATPSLWIAIEEDGTVKITCHRSEMGQQVWTSMAQIVADELEADWDKVAIVQAEGHERYGDQNTDGSRSVRYNFHRLRTAGAAMRQMLTQAAALFWEVDASQCTAEAGLIRNTDSGETLSYGNLAELAAKLPVPAEDAVTLKEPEEWRFIGKEVPSLTIPKITRGEGEFGIDVDVPDMVYAVIARPPQVFGRVGSVDETAALAVPGVLQTVRLPDPSPPALFQPMGGVAVIAKDTWAAIQGRNALKLGWRDGPNAAYDSDAFGEALRATSRREGTVRRSRGDVDAGLGAAAKTITAEYYAPHLTQSPMEPPSGTARWTDDRLECWGCVQDPQETRNALSEALGIDKEKITVTPTWLGGAFGRKSKPDFMIEAALLAKEVGKPVKVTWTREDDVRHGFYHAVSAQRMEAGLDESGNCTSYLHRTTFPSISSTFANGVTSPSAGELGLGATDVPFAIPNLRVESGEARGHVRTGWLRSVCNVFHAFAVQSFAGELAHAAGKDQKDYLLELIGPDRIIDPASEGAEYGNYGGSSEEYPIETARLKAVVNKAADMAGWGRQLPDRHGLGIAVHRSFLAYVATVVEVEVSPEGDLAIPGVWVALDAGTVINPRHVRAQMEGGTLYGLSNALYGEITAKNGAIVQDNFPSWRLMKMAEAPRAFEVEIIRSNKPPAGVGEPGTPPAAPALANAIFAATGTRLRTLPLIGARGSRLPLSSETNADTQIA
ncbi:MAG: molybdopterin-dependent oxidoreductase [Erythrobacter sp.]|uniref:xanthine dehydrogenase family protein molybdopterin-binding subunit n=1 Tax=Erythrobacter sp. TaxID=1042 RepID=UPI00261A1293|nr:molybdopterin cofactor-binding domain-containing protein [Erythrobacter sp.]MDJ0977180.1 molybdopterin-dependent oxidoreductase [Erythrobacter sp.]